MGADWTDPEAMIQRAEAGDPFPTSSAVPSAEEMIQHAERSGPTEPPKPQGPRQLSNEEKQDLLVDRNTGGPGQLQAGFSLQHGSENRRRWLEKNVGAENSDWRMDAKGEAILINKGNGRETALLPARFSFPAFLGGEGPRTLGAGLGGAAGALGGPGGAVAGGTLGGTGGEFLKRALTNPPQSPEGWNSLVLQVAKDVGPEELMAEVFGLGVGRVLARGTAPLGRMRRLSDQQQEIYAAARRAIERTGLRVERRKLSPMRMLSHDRPATPADILDVASLSGSKSFARLYAIAEKVPGSGGVIEKELLQQGAQSTQLRVLAEGPPVYSSRVGHDAVRILDAQFQQDVRYLQQVQQGAERMVGDRVAARGIPSGRAKPIHIGEAAEIQRMGYAARYKVFDDQYNAMFNRAEGLPGGNEEVVHTLGWKMAHRKIMKDIPVDETTGKPNLLAMPEGVRTALESFSNVGENVTIRQARRMRAKINEMIRSPQMEHGFREGDLKQLSGSITRSLRRVESEFMTKANVTVGRGETAQALKGANEYYSKNIDGFLDRDVIDLGLGSARRDRQLFSDHVRAGRTDAVERIRNFFGEDSPEWQAGVAGTWNRMLDESLDMGRAPDLVDGPALLQRWKGLGSEMQQQLFGRDAAQIGYELRALDASQHIAKYDLDVFRGWRDPVVTRLQNARILGAQAADSWRNEVLTPFLNGGLGPETFVGKTNASQFTRFLMTKGAPEEAEAVLARLRRSGPQGDRAIEDIRKQVIQDLLHNSEKGTVGDIVRAAGTDLADVVDKPFPIGSRVGRPMRQDVRFKPLPLRGERIQHLMETRYGGTAVESMTRLKSVLGEEQLQLMKDLALVSAAAQQQVQAAKAAGGLVAGTILNRLWRGGVVRFSQDAIRYRFMAALLQTPGTRRWLAGEFVLPRTTTGVRTAVFSGSILGAIRREFEDEPETFDEIARSMGLTPKQARQQLPLEQSFKVSPARMAPGPARRMR